MVGTCVRREKAKSRVTTRVLAYSAGNMELTFLM